MTSEEQLKAVLEENDLIKAENAELVAANVELRKDSARIEWFFGKTNKGRFIEVYMRGIKEDWSVDQWRAAIDQAKK